MYVLKFLKNMLLKNKSVLEQTKQILWVVSETMLFCCAQSYAINFKKVDLIKTEAYKKQQNLCVGLLRQNKKDYFETLDIKSITGNKMFWKTVAPLFSNKNFAFSKNMKAGTVLVDLSAAYGTVWHRGLTLKLLQIIPTKDMVRMIMSVITQRRFSLNIGPDRCRCRTLVNGVPQGSVLSPILFNIYTHDIPQLLSEKYIYADDIALLHCHPHIAAIEKTLSLDLKTLSQYFHNWRLRINTTKIVCSVFHLANLLSKYELNASVDGVKIAF